MLTFTQIKQDGAHMHFFFKAVPGRVFCKSVVCAIQIRDTSKLSHTDNDFFSNFVSFSNQRLSITCIYLLTYSFLYLCIHTLWGKLKFFIPSLCSHIDSPESNSENQTGGLFTQSLVMMFFHVLEAPAQDVPGYQHCLNMKSRDAHLMSGLRSLQCLFI